MKNLSPEEAVRILGDMMVKSTVPRAAETQIKRNAALEMAIKALATDINVGDKDTISRANAIEALTKDKKELEHIINGMSGYEKEFDSFVGQRNQVNYDIYAIEQLPPAQLAPDNNGDLWITVPDIDEVTCIYVQESKSKFCRIFYEEQEQPEPYVGHWIPVGGALYQCDQCGVVSLKRKFCSECGADMRGTNK